MPLSEHEQRILEEIERRLAAEDPKFARATAVVTPRGVAIRRIKRAAVLFVGGLLLLLTGAVMGSELLLAFGLAGFAVMLGAVIVVSRAMKGVASAPASEAEGPSWFERFEDRWRKRFENGSNGS